MAEQDAFQFRIALLGILPMIWRRIRVPADYSFWDLHVAIQDAMGWNDSHLHEFRVTNPKTSRQDLIGIPDDEGFDERKVIPGWKRLVQSYLSYESPLGLYEYDFGDSWLHEIVLEADVQPEDPLPSCIAGERACPPDDVGGPPGYEEFVKAIQDPKLEEHESTMEWVGGAFDPEQFDPRAVTFDSPNERWRLAFGTSR